MTINDIDTKASTIEETVIGDPTPGISTNVDLTSIAEVLGGNIDKNSAELRAIKDFISKDNPQMSMADTAWAVKELLLRLGTPKFGESNLDRLYQYVYLRTERDKIDNKLNILGGKHE